MPLGALPCTERGQSPCSLPGLPLWCEALQCPQCLDVAWAHGALSANQVPLLDIQDIVRSNPQAAKTP